MGFVTYQYTTRHVSFGLSGLSEDIYNMWNKRGTMFVVSRLLSGGNIFDIGWISSTLFVLIGYTAYYLLIGLRGTDVTNNSKLQAMVDDWLMTGTMLIVSQLLGGGAITDLKWMRSSIETLLGYTAYDIGTSHIF
jgi:hypothetical protein